MRRPDRRHPVEERRRRARPAGDDVVREVVGDERDVEDHERGRRDPAQRRTSSGAPETTQRWQAFARRTGTRRSRRSCTSSARISSTRPAGTISYRRPGGRGLVLGRALGRQRARLARRQPGRGLVNADQYAASDLERTGDRALIAHRDGEVTLRIPHPEIQRRRGPAALDDRAREDVLGVELGAVDQLRGGQLAPTGREARVDQRRRQQHRHRQRDRQAYRALATGIHAAGHSRTFAKVTTPHPGSADMDLTAESESCTAPAEPEGTIEGPERPRSSSSLINVALAGQEKRPRRETNLRCRRYKYASACEKQNRRPEAATQPEQRTEAGLGRGPGASARSSRRSPAAPRACHPGPSDVLVRVRLHLPSGRLDLSRLPALWRLAGLVARPRPSDRPA